MKDEEGVDFVRSIVKKYDLTGSITHCDGSEKEAKQELLETTHLLIESYNDSISIDLIFGQKSIFVLLLASPEVQEEYYKLIEQKCEWSTVKK